LPTYDLNRIVSGDLNRGVPEKSLTLLVGTEHTFKSSLMVLCLKNALKEGYTPVIIDTEGGITASFCERWGLDSDKVLYNYTPYGHEILGILAQIKESQQEKFFIILDSCGGVDKQKGFDDALKGTYKQDMGGVARILKSVLKLLTNIVKSQNSIGVISSHFYSQSGTVPMPDSVVGGKAILLLPDIVLYLKKAGKTDTGKTNADKLINVMSIKNRFYPGDKIGHVNINYSEGIDKFGGLTEIAKDIGVIEQRGSYVYLNGENIAQGMGNFQDILKEDEKIQKLFIEKINEYLKTTQYSTADEKELKDELKEVKENLMTDTEKEEKPEEKSEEPKNQKKKTKYKYKK
jgi:recombination protein RecA